MFLQHSNYISHVFRGVFVPCNHKKEKKNTYKKNSICDYSVEANS